MHTYILRFFLLFAASATNLSAQIPIYQNPDMPIEVRVEDALSRMTLEEKVALCHAQSKFSSAGVPRLGIPELWMSDGPHGVRHEFEWNTWNYAGWTNDSITAFPALTALAATWNPDMAARYGKAIGEEARYRKKDVLLGPGVNIYRTPLNGRNFEYMGEDPYLAGVMAVPYVKELQKNGVAACVKHFALNNQELWRGTVDVEVSDRALYEIYLPAFKQAIVEGGAWSVMGAYNKYRGQHCCHNARLLNDILRDEWGFDGCVITDWGGAHDTKEAAFNGLDIEMGSYTNGLTSDNSLGYNLYYLADSYLEMLKKGELPMASVDAKARNILRLIFRTSLNQNKPYGSLCTKEHYDVAKVIGDESIVLLRNNGILPLQADKYNRILVVGDNAVRRLTDGGGSSELKPKEIYLPAFKQAIVEGGAWSVMGAYNKYRGQHCCHNARLLNDILRDEWGFDGCVITDWGGAHDTKEAAFNGLDIEMGSYTNGLTSDNSLGYNLYYLADSYLEMLKKGELPMASVDAKARNILRLIFRTSLNQNKPYGSLCTKEHYDVAKVIGDESIVLLRNNGILPLQADKYNRILVVGDNAVRRLTDGGGSSELKPKDMISPLDALRALYGDKIEYTQGYACGRPFFGHEEEMQQTVIDSLRAEAVAKARQADVVIYVGGLNKNAFQDCESTDRKSYNLPFSQNELIEELVAVNPNLVIANISGNAYAMPWLKKVPAILHISYLGTMGGASIADVISGKVNPSGKLPYSFPVKLSDCSAHSFGEGAYPGIDTGKEDVSLTDYQRNVGVNPKEEYKDDILVGYRWHDTKKIPALFSFGHGLSYASFKYGKSRLSSKTMDEKGSIKVTVPLTNTGTRIGKEVVQLYLGDPVCSVIRPLKELKHFTKVEVEPDETVQVEFVITPDDLKFFDEASHRWVAESGVFNVYVGTSSADIRCMHSFKYICD